MSGLRKLVVVTVSFAALAAAIVWVVEKSMVFSHQLVAVNPYEVAAGAMIVGSIVAAIGTVIVLMSDD